MAVFHRFALILALTLTACESAQEKAAHYASQAQGQLEAGDLPGAEQSIKDAIAARDDNVDIFLLKGQIDVASGNYAAAYNSYKSALALDQTNQTALSFVANIGIRMGDTQAATTAADQLLALNPTAVVGLQVKGLAAFMKRDYDGTLSYVAKIFAIDPNDQAGAMLQARALTMQGKTDEAFAILSRSLAAKGDDPGLLSALLNVQRRAGRAQDMMATFERLRKKTPDDRAMILDYANLLYKTGHAQPAREYLLALLLKPQNAAVYKTITRLWSEYDEHPLDAKGLAQLGSHASTPALQEVLHYLQLDGQYPLARALLDRLPQSQRNTFSAMSGRIFLALGRKDEARALSGEALAQDPENIDALLLDAELAIADKRPADAIRQAEVAVRNDPLNASATIILARAYDAKGQVIRARAVYEEGLKRNPQDQFLSDAYRRYLHNLGDKDRALEIARKFTLASPASVKGWHNWAQECQRANAGCTTQAQEGEAQAVTMLALDDPPGTAPNNGLFGKF